MLLLSCVRLIVSSEGADIFCKHDAVLDSQIPVSVRAKVWACSCFIVGMAGSNLADGVDVFPFICSVLCRQRSLRRADHSSRGFLLSVFVCIELCDLETSTV